jgi:hypothetical protein
LFGYSRNPVRIVHLERFEPQLQLLDLALQLL